MSAFDALVIGAGPAGSTAALVLARAGWKVALVEKASFPRRKVCGEYISAASWSLLRELGLAEAMEECAGPEVRQVGFYAAQTMLSSDMPRPGGATQFGRALGREHLDTLLAARAQHAGAQLFQPASVVGVARSAEGFACRIASRAASGDRELTARVVIAAHGAWEPGNLPTQDPRPPRSASDLLAFKAHFHDARLPPGLMPLVLFPGGYGGMVHSDSGRVSFSCCIRRATLERLRLAHAGTRAGEAVIAHVIASCRGVREALEAATLEESWLSAGPIRPGFRPLRRGGVFAIGNAAGEAHPLVAEGISMAIQSAFLLCETLLAKGSSVLSERGQEIAAREYAGAWRRNFAARVHAAALFANLTVNRVSAPAAVAFLKAVPAVLTFGARLSGKAQPLRHLAPLPEISP